MGITILNIETSTKVCSVCIAVDGVVKALRESLDENYSHSEKLNVFIRDVMNELDLEMFELDAIAVSKGPGSFTGLRIGVSTAKGFAYALDLPLISCNTLECLAKGAKSTIELKENDLFIPMIDARRREVYMQIFDAELNAKSEIEAKEIDYNSFSDLLKGENKIHLIGDGAGKFSDEFQDIVQVNVHANYLASASSMSELSYASFSKEKFEDLAYFEPYYLKDFIAIKPRKIF